MNGAWEKALRVFGTLLCAAVLLSTILKGGGGTDLNILLDAANNLRAGRTVYNLADANEHTKPPLATLLFVPLTELPRSWAQGAWAVLVLVGFVALARFLVRVFHRAPPAASTWLILALMTTLNPWNKELRLSQYNVLTLIFVLAAGLGRRSASGGALAAIAVLLKPTNVIFLPWVLRHARRRWALIGGGLAAVAALAAIYVAAFGFDALIRDHRTWLEFLPVSGAKHLHREDNFGLVRAIDDWGAGRLLPAVWAIGWGLVLFAAFRTAGWLTGLVVAALACILLTPMGWFQNFVLALPYVVWLLVRVFSPGPTVTRAGFAAALAILYWGLEVHPALCGSPRLIGSACSLPVPLWCLLASIAATLVAITPRVGLPEST